jgi:hypothetical protein
VIICNGLEELTAEVNPVKLIYIAIHKHYLLVEITTQNYEEKLYLINCVTGKYYLAP